MPDICNANSFSSRVLSLNSSSATGECASAISLCEINQRSASKAEPQMIATQAAASNINGCPNGAQGNVDLFPHRLGGGLSANDKRDVVLESLGNARNALNGPDNDFILFVSNLSHHREWNFNFNTLRSRLQVAKFSHESGDYPSLFVNAALKVHPSFPLECIRCDV